MSDGTSGCVSNTRNVVIKNTAVKPALSLVVNQINTGCEPAAADGSMTVTITTPDADADYTVEWYAGTITSGGAPLTSGMPNAGYTPTIVNDLVSNPKTSTITGLYNGAYYAVVTDFTTPNNNCSFNIAKTIVQDATFNIDLNLTPTANTFCSPGNGSVVITSVD